MNRNGQNRNEDTTNVRPVPRKDLKQELKNQLIEIQKSETGELPTAFQNMSAAQLMTLIDQAGNESLEKIKSQLEGAKNFDGCRITYERTFNVKET